MLFFLFLSVAHAFVPSTKVYNHHRTTTVVAAELDPSLIPLVAAGAVSVIGIGAAITLGGAQKDSPPTAPPPAPPAPTKKVEPAASSPPAAAPAVAAVATTSASAPSTGLVKACWSGDAFKGYEWPAPEEGETSTVSTIEAWREACSAKGATSYWDFGVRVIEWSPLSAPAAAPAKTVTSAEWRAACDSTGVTSFYDFGLRLA